MPLFKLSKFNLQRLDQPSLTLIYLCTYQLSSSATRSDIPIPNPTTPVLALISRCFIRSPNSSKTGVSTKSMSSDHCSRRGAYTMPLFKLSKFNLQRLDRPSLTLIYLLDQGNGGLNFILFCGCFCQGYGIDFVHILFLLKSYLRDLIGDVLS